MAHHQLVLPTGLPTPRPSTEGLGSEFWAATREHRLVVQRCRSCLCWQWGPELLCHQCYSAKLFYEEVKGAGTIFSWQRVWHPVHSALRGAVPYLIVLVELTLPKGIRMVGNVIGDQLQDISFGDEVEAVFEDHEDPDFTLVQWRLKGARVT